MAPPAGARGWLALPRVAPPLGPVKPGHEGIRESRALRYLDGKPINDDDVKKTRIAWTDNKISTLSPHIWADVVVATLAVDPTTRPGQMDIVYEANPGTPALAIYEWLGPDRYRICIASARQMARRPHWGSPSPC